MPGNLSSCYIMELSQKSQDIVFCWFFLISKDRSKNCLLLPLWSYWEGNRQRSGAKQESRSQSALRTMVTLIINLPVKFNSSESHLFSSISSYWYVTIDTKDLCATRNDTNESNFLGIILNIYSNHQIYWSDLLMFFMVTLY